jgi:S-adenosylmethionine synthetase
MRSASAQSPGHPDKACDIIVESVVDEYMHRDPTTSLRLHACGGRGAMFIAGVASSKADFDVGAVVTRTAASLGVRGHIEPFVSIEPVTGSFLLEATRTNRPISVMGYATRETEERIPSHVLLAKRVAKQLEDLRQYDAAWYWLEPSFEVSAVEMENGMEVFVTCAHGEEHSSAARQHIREALTLICDSARVRVNEQGTLRAGGLDADIGASGVSDHPYGHLLPLPVSTIGCDPSNPQKFGTWLARGLARRALERSNAKAVMVQATYIPGDRFPTILRVRDERGKNLLEDGDAERMSYSYLRERLRPALSTNAAHWGFAGEVELPWEGEVE